MKISMKMSVILAAIFAVICFGVAITGFSSLGDLADPEQRADGQGFAWFWTFLGVVATAFGVLGWWILKTQSEGEEP
jgi:membrane protease YdiL (CAAX protease family)